MLLERLRAFSKSLNEHKPVSIGLLDSSTASLYVPFLIASTVFLVEPVSFAICELLNSSGYLFISHNLSVVRYLANTVAIMYLGRIVEQGPVEELFNNPKHPYTTSLLNSVPDLGDRKPFEPLTGDVPSPLQPPAACHFHPRCPIYLEEEQGSSLAKKCTMKYPEISGDKNRFVRCHAEQ